MAPSKRFMLDANIEFATPVGDADVLTRIIDVLRAMAPAWSSSVVAWDGPNNRESLNLADRVSLQARLARPLPSKRESLPLGSYDGQSLPEVKFAELRNLNDDALTVLFDTDQRSVRRMGDAWQWANRLSLQIRRATIEGQPSELWALAAMAALCALPAAAYGRAGLSDEFRASNLDESLGVRAIGIDISRYLPGLYWCNFFGAPYAALIGQPRLLTAPAPGVQVLGEGVMLQLADDPRSWNEPVYAATKRKVLESLGPEFFFDRTAPQNPTRGIDPYDYLGASPLTY